MRRSSCSCSCVRSRARVKLWKSLRFPWISVQLFTFFFYQTWEALVHGRCVPSSLNISAGQNHLPSLIFCISLPSANILNCSASVHTHTSVATFLSLYFPLTLLTYLNFCLHLAPAPISVVLQLVVWNKGPLSLSLKSSYSVSSPSGSAQCSYVPYDLMCGSSRCCPPAQDRHWQCFRLKKDRINQWKTAAIEPDLRADSKLNKI